MDNNELRDDTKRLEASNALMEKAIAFYEWRDHLRKFFWPFWALVFAHHLCIAVVPLAYFQSPDYSDMRVAVIYVTLALQLMIFGGMHWCHRKGRYYDQKAEGLEKLRAVVA